MINLSSKDLRAFQKEIADNVELYQKILVRELSYLLEELINDAKLTGAYQNRTGNLRSSVGGCVLVNGRKAKSFDFDAVQGPKGDGKEGTITGETFLNTIINKYQKGIVLIVIAGMKYAVYVENNYQLNVLEHSKNLMTAKLAAIKTNIKRQLEKR